MKKYEYLDRRGTFRLESPDRFSYLYFPIANEAGVLGSVTPTWGGDSKLGQNAFLLEPVSAENLHNNRSSRNFWLYEKDTDEGEDGMVWSATGVSAAQIAGLFGKKQERTVLTAGMLWQQVTRVGEEVGLLSEITAFAPISGEKLELMKVVVTNQSNRERRLVPTAAIPMYGRSADNIRDHRHVTSLLHRAYLTRNGVFLNPTLTFDERGHQKNELVYGVLGVEGDGSMPSGFFPQTEEFIGEGGSLEWPKAVVCNEKASHQAGEEIDGYETIGAIRFGELVLAPGQSAAYVVGLGYGASVEELTESFARFDSAEKFDRALEENKKYWRERLNIFYETSDTDLDNWMYWVNFQPILRRIYGCSFLPHHDYGRGGRGWRDLWQDCLALLMMEPEGVRTQLYNNFGGVRIDGSNATIIGKEPGEFIADRNQIARVWMDHGVWPFLTTELYINQSGDLEFLLERASYFKDAQAARGEKRDGIWKERQGSNLRTAAGEVYQGTILEHLLVQHLTAFYDVGEHNHIRLRGADWNDALDMAKERGESVAFTGMYGDNLEHLAGLVLELSKKTGVQTVFLAEELRELLEDREELYENAAEKQTLLAHYCQSCVHTISGVRVEVPVRELAACLSHMASWLKEHIRRTEWIEDGEGHHWFNGYYDNHGRPLEGGDRMMLTSQVFAIMSGTAKQNQIREILQAADALLYHKEVGGYRLNTNFHELKMDMGRMFGFAYGTKENGAVFSHMTVMFANALYRRGFAKEGFKAINTLAQHCMDMERSRMYPGVPEYIDPSGRGMYHYLTGAASWLLLTVVTEVFGVRGELGNLRLAPALKAEQFAADGRAGIHLQFAGRRLFVDYRNPKKLEAGMYQVTRLEIDGRFYPMAGESFLLSEKSRNGALLPRRVIEELSETVEHRITVTLG